jgi:hypothetical protein
MASHNAPAAAFRRASASESILTDSGKKLLQNFLKL